MTFPRPTEAQRARRREAARAARAEAKRRLRAWKSAHAAELAARRKRVRHHLRDLAAEVAKFRGQWVAEAQRRFARAWRRSNPDKVAAHRAVAEALADGVLERRPCEVCGVRRVHAHHDDYARPLDVRWLCPTHHRAHHREKDSTL